jgi:hypothetical protein
MRIGTWNLQGRWDQRHLEQISAMRCEILLLTEVSERVELPGMRLHLGDSLIAPHRRWAAVASSNPLRALTDPHGASAMAEIDGLRVCSSILPWRGCGAGPPWTGTTTAAKTQSAITSIEAAAPQTSIEGRGSGSSTSRRW